jgi:hypothetical protein
MKNNMAKTVNIERHVWEGWRVKDFIEDLAPQLNQIMSGKSYIEPFEYIDQLADWCTSNQPGYKRLIPEVVNYFADKYGIR